MTDMELPRMKIKIVTTTGDVIAEYVAVPKCVTVAETSVTWIDSKKLEALLAAWNAVPEHGQVPKGVGDWLQPLINAVTEIVKPEDA